MSNKVILSKGKEKSLKYKHPWIFSGAIKKILPDDLEIGAVVDVYSHKDEFLGRGFYSQKSQISVRLLTFDKEEKIDKEFLRKKIRNAISLRDAIWDKNTHNAMRLVHGESDGLPGLVIDRYNNTLSVQILSAGFENMRSELITILKEECSDCRIYERSDNVMRDHEGLQQRKGPICGDFSSCEAEVFLNGVKWCVNVEDGQKTGCYLDQVENWEKVGRLSKNKDVLDAFCYNGGFSLACLKNGAKSICSLDSSDIAIENVKKNALANGFNSPELICDNAFDRLRKFRDCGRTFDLIILDPPKFATSKYHLEQATRAYKDINLLAFKLLRPGGLLATFSCSGAMTPQLFQQVISSAALDAGKNAKIVESYIQAADHPVALNYPEGLYLKGLLLYVD